MHRKILSALAAVVLSGSILGGAGTAFASTTVTGPHGGTHQEMRGHVRHHVRHAKRHVRHHVRHVRHHVRHVRHHARMMH
jgi:nicotinamide mononucleotide (NMN) deamidase PncC